ncbi:MAG: gluconolactonase [Lentisphaerae bacterium RIFOXYA12_FULL_48_11]|nr:MAG: gluconolactonase [Lentisphaerae bacterium RIFOXYA12_FULL_48_11]
MNNKICCSIIVINLLLIPFVPAQDRSPVAPGAQLEKLSEEFKFTEGPTADAEGNVYFTDQPNDRIMKYGVDGKLSTFKQPAGRSNGMYFDAQGRLWACADEKNELWRIDVASGKVEVILKDRDGKLFNGPNDLWITPAGDIYFTDPLYKRPWWSHRTPEAQMPQAVYYLSASGKLTVADADVKQPNGITGTPDGKVLYVADIGDKKTYVYDIQPGGKLANRKLFCSEGSDGMTIDSEGNVYLTGKGVLVFDKTGQQITHIEVPGGWTANVSFGGKDKQTLFITASKCLFSLKMRVKGVSQK